MEANKNWNQALIVDDNPLMRNLLLRIAQGAGYSVLGCASLDELKRAYATSRSTVIIADLILGEEDCEPILDFLAKIHCKVPLILVTGHVAGFLDVIEAARGPRGCQLSPRSRSENRCTRSRIGFWSFAFRKWPRSHESGLREAEGLLRVHTRMP